MIEEEVTMEQNNFFSNAVINLKILKFENSDPLSENIKHPLKTIVKYRKHPSVIAIVPEFTNECFFNTITIEDALKEISMSDSSKFMHAMDLPVKVMKGSSIFLQNKYAFISISKEKFPDCLKLADITPVFKKTARTSKNNSRAVSILPMFSEIF